MAQVFYVLVCLHGGWTNFEMKVSTDVKTGEETHPAASVGNRKAQVFYVLLC